MHYIGSKSKLAKFIVPHIKKVLQPHQFYVEPFFGVGSVAKYFYYHPNVICNYINSDIISLFVKLQSGWIPPTKITKEQYYHVKNNEKNCPVHERAFVLYGCSFAGKKNAGYAFSNDKTNYAEQATISLLRRIKLMKHFAFESVDYRELEIPDNSIIYCDPPYSGTLGYEKNGKNSFDTSAFWNWCDDMAKKGHKIFVSEYNIPEHWKVIMKKTVKCYMDKTKGKYKSRVELLATNL